MAPKRAAPTRKVVAAAALNVRLRNSRTSISGRSARSEWRTNSGDEHDAGDHRAPHDGIGEAAVRLALGQSEDEQPEAGREQQQPVPVEPSGVGAAGVGLEQLRRQHQRERGDRDVDVEDPAPRHRVDDQAADDRAEDRPEQHRHADHAHHPADPRRPRRLGEQGHPDRHDHAAAEALQDAEEDQRLGRPGEPAEGAADAEQRDRDHPDPLRAEALGHPARQRDHGGEREQVARRDPLDRVERRIELARQRLERDVDDRRVEDRHDHAGHDDRGDDPDLAAEWLARRSGCRGGASHPVHFRTAGSYMRRLGPWRRSRCPTVEVSRNDKGRNGQPWVIFPSARSRCSSRGTTTARTRSSYCAS